MSRNEGLGGGKLETALSLLSGCCCPSAGSPETSFPETSSPDSDESIVRDGCVGAPDAPGGFAGSLDGGNLAIAKRSVWMLLLVLPARALLVQ
jgi:hypothetical protein